MTINEEISKFRSGLSYNEFKNLFINSTAVKQNPSLMGQVDSYWNFYNKKEPTASKPSGDSTTVGGVVKSFAETQNLNRSVMSYSGEGDVIQPSAIVDQAQQALQGFFGEGGSMMNGFSGMFDQAMSMAVTGITDILGKQVKLHNDINSALSISGDMSQAFRDNLISTLPSVAAMGYGFEDLSKTVIDMMKDTGRLSTFSVEVLEKLPEVSRAYTDNMETLGAMFRDYELVGISAGKTLTAIEDAGEKSLQVGLNARKVVKDLGDNVGKLNSFGFKDGIDGMSRMVQRSVEFRMNMENVFKVAEDLFDPDKAIDLSANLQAIGGAIGDFNDPLKLMYMATNNVEGLQDALIGVAGSLATYNQEQGRFEITGVNLRKARAMANELGISYEDLAKTAIASAERSSAATDLLASGLNIDEKQKEFLTNISRMENGRMVIDVSNMSDQFQGLKEVALSELTENQKDILLKNQEAFKELSTEDIAKNQYTETQKMALNVGEIAAILKVQFAKTMNPTLREGDKLIASANKYIQGALGDGGNGLGKELDRLKTEVNKSSQEYLGNERKLKREDLIQDKNTNNTPSTQTSSNESRTVVVKHEVKMSETNLDAFSRYLAQTGNMGSETVEREYTNTTT